MVSSGLNNKKMSSASKDTVVMDRANRSFPLAAYLTYALCHQSVPNILLDSLGGMFAERCKTVRIGEVVLDVIISPYTKEVLKLVEVILERKVPMIVITDSDLNPLAPFRMFVWK